jgi:hypothetical protein
MALLVVIGERAPKRRVQMDFGPQGGGTHSDTVPSCADLGYFKEGKVSESIERYGRICPMPDIILFGDRRA